MSYIEELRYMRRIADEKTRCKCGLLLPNRDFQEWSDRQMIQILLNTIEILEDENKLRCDEPTN